ARSSSRSAPVRSRMHAPLRPSGRLYTAAVEPKPPFLVPSSSGARPSVTIVGAGVAGLTIGYQLARQGYRVTVVETNATVGGLARTFPYGDFPFAFRPHC